MFTADNIKHQELSAMEDFKKGDRVIVNFGTQDDPEYYSGSVIAISNKTNNIKVKYDDGEMHIEPVDDTGSGVIGFLKNTQKIRSEIPANKILNLIDQERWHVPSIKKLIKGQPTKQNKPSIKDKSIERLAEKNDKKLVKKDNAFKERIAQEITDIAVGLDLKVNGDTNVSEIIKYTKIVYERIQVLYKNLDERRVPFHFYDDTLYLDIYINTLRVFLDHQRERINIDEETLKYLKQYSWKPNNEETIISPISDLSLWKVVDTLSSLHILSYPSNIHNSTLKRSAIILSRKGMAKLQRALNKMAKEQYDRRR